MTNRKGTLIVLSGPSGTGKGTVLKHFFDNYADDAVKLSISATTRLPRNGETDGVNYFFVEKENLEKTEKIKKYENLEQDIWAKNKMENINKPNNKMIIAEKENFFIKLKRWFFKFLKK